MHKYYLLLLLLLGLVAATFVGLRAYWPYARHARFQERLREIEAEPPFHNGDLIFQTSASAQSRAIQLATHSPYSHCGILYRQGNEWRVYEAMQPVSDTPLHSWILRGTGHHFVVKRLRDADQVLTPAVLRRLRMAGEQYRGKNYDLYFGWSDDRMYCSELLWKMYQQATGREIGQRQRLREFDLSHPAVRAKLQERYGNQIPLDEWVISPVQMLESRELVTVVER